MIINDIHDPVIVVNKDGVAYDAIPSVFWSDNDNANTDVITILYIITATTAAHTTSTCLKI